MQRIIAKNRQNVEQIERKPRDVTGIGLSRSELTLKLAERLEAIAKVSGDAKVVLNARKLSLCGSPRNIYIGSDMHNSDGECFEGLGHLWACRLGFCQNCQALQAGKNRKAIRGTLKELKHPVGTKWNFVTLTSPSVPVPLLTSIKANLRAWVLFRQKRWFDKTVYAGWKNIEFTVNEKTGLAHVHIHALMLSKFLYPSQVRATWQESIIKAYSELGVSLSFGTSGAVIDVRPITRKNSSEMESAILEVAKYTSKGSSWLSLSDSDLLAVSRLDKLPRLFSSFGNSHRKKGTKKSETNRLDTQHLKEAPKKPRKMQHLSTLNLKVNVSRTWRKRQLKLKYECADFRTLDGKSFLPEPLGTEPREAKLKLVKGNKKQ